MSDKIDAKIKAIVKPRKANSHKGTYGHALIIAGSKGKMGAAAIAAKACLRAGIGLLTVNVPTEERGILQVAIPEAMLVMREEENSLENFTAACIGPAIGTDSVARSFLINFLENFPKPILLDADALTIVASNMHFLSFLMPGAVITPHPIEFDRLFGKHDSTKARLKTAIAEAKKHRLVIVLKGHKTLVTYNGETFINSTGNAGLAKGGSGDALSGIITAFLAQGYTPFNAAKLGVYIHGLAADIALKKQSMESMLITDTIDCLGDAFKMIG